MKLSPFVFEYKIDENYTALYHSLNQTTIYLNNSIAEKISSQNFSNDSLPKYQSELLIDKSFLVDLEFDIESEISKMRNNLIPKVPRFSVLYLILTNACNFRCKYCFVDDGKGLAKSSKDEIFLSQKTAMKALTLFNDLCEKSKSKLKTVYFYGGEPLLNFSTLKFFLEEVKKQDLNKFRFVLVTNGSIYSDEIAETLIKHNVVLCFSIDGPPEIHDKMRVNVMNKKTSSIVLNNYRKFSAAGIVPHISCTLNEANYNEIENIVKYFQSIQTPSFAFNILHGNLEMLNKPSVSEIAEKLTKLYPYLRENALYEDRIMRRVKSFVEKKFWIKDCAGCGHQIVVTPSGMIGPCQAFAGSGNYFKHTVNDSSESIFSSKIFNEWNNRCALNNSDCYLCSAISMCGGGCAYDAHIEKGSIHKIDDRICLLVKPILKWLINDGFNYVQISKNN